MQSQKSANDKASGQMPIFHTANMTPYDDKVQPSERLLRYDEVLMTIWRTNLSLISSQVMAGRN
ncbi:hypothetical protein BTA51_20470 [Hahella sp. CCB-MM4]|nr:hypothetical protein BTA51_20470 [Hahella sp. CCB-MM4]